VHATPGAQFPVIWRTKLRSELEGVIHADQVSYCTTHNAIGPDGPGHLPDGAHYETVIHAVGEITDPRWQLTSRRSAEARPHGYIAEGRAKEESFSAPT